MVTLQEEGLVLMNGRDTERDVIARCASCNKPITGKAKSVGHNKRFNSITTYLYFHDTARDCADAEDTHMIMTKNHDVRGVKLG
jgi:hypothetical protein